MMLPVKAQVLTYNVIAPNMEAAKYSGEHKMCLTAASMNSMALETTDNVVYRFPDTQSLFPVSLSKS